MDKTNTKPTYIPMTVDNETVQVRQLGRREILREGDVYQGHHRNFKCTKSDAGVHVGDSLRFYRPDFLDHDHGKE